MKKHPTYRLTICALFAALTAVLSQISIPIGPVPINLATFSVYLSGSVLGGAAGALSQTVFVLLGAIGLPVYAQFSGGIGALAGPTGGYLVGYIAAAWLTGILGTGGKSKYVRPVFAMVAATVVLYAMGTAWFLFSTKMGLWKALTLCVFPFLIGDSLKIALAAFLTPRIRGALGKIGPAAERK